MAKDGGLKIYGMTPDGISTPVGVRETSSNSKTGSVNSNLVLGTTLSTGLKIGQFNDSMEIERKPPKGGILDTIFVF